jgi:hypothetical protein
MIHYPDRWAFATGASSGLGRGLAARLADARGLHAERTFTIRPTPDGLKTVVVSHETQVGLLPWLGRVFLARRLRAANQAMFDDLARAAGHGAATQATPAAELHRSRSA